MERGTDREREAVRDRWQSLEERRRATDRLLFGVLAASAGLVFLFLAFGREACGFTIGGATAECSAVGSQLTVIGFGLVGVIALGYGLWSCWSAWHR